MKDPSLASEAVPAPRTPSGRGESACADAADSGWLPDLGDPAARRTSGVAAPHRPEALEEFLHATRARIAVGAAGPRPRTGSYLRFLADHARSKDTVLKEVPEAWLRQRRLWSLCTLAEDKGVYLTRPDLGRALSPAAVQALRERYPVPTQVQVVLSDGLSTEALLVNYEEILPLLLKGLHAAGLSTGDPFFLKHGRVKAEDVIGAALGCDVVVLLIGERPGLGQSESLSCYAVYRPTRATLESERTVISNIHSGGTPPVEAAAVIVELVTRMLRHKASGIALNRACEAAEKA